MKHVLLLKALGELSSCQRGDLVAYNKDNLSTNVQLVGPSKI